MDFVQKPSVYTRPSSSLTEHAEVSKIETGKRVGACASFYSSFGLIIFWQHEGKDNAKEVNWLIISGM